MPRATTHDALSHIMDRIPDTVTKQQIDDKNVNRMFQLVIISGVKLVPGIGGILSAVSTLIWPSKTDTEAIWLAFEPRIKDLVEDAINRNDAEKLNPHIVGLCSRVNNFLGEINNDRLRQQNFQSLVHHLMDISPTFLATCAKAPALSLPYLVSFGTLHITVLYLRHTRYKYIYGNEDDSFPYHCTNLDETIDRYKDAVLAARAACIELRKKKIQRGKTWDTPTMMYTTLRDTTVKDRFIGAAREKRFIWEEPPEAVHGLGPTGKERDATGGAMADLTERNWKYEVDTQYAAQIDDLILPSRYWDLYRPDISKAKSSNLIVDYHGWLGGGKGLKLNWFDDKAFYESHGNITKIVLYSGWKSKTPVAGGANKSYMSLIGFEIFYGGASSGLRGNKNGDASVLEVGRDEVVNKWGFSRSDRGCICHLSFTKSRVLRDQAGGIADLVDIPGVSIVGAGNTNNGMEERSVKPLYLRWLSGWSEDPEGNILMIWPVFGIREEIETANDGKRTTRWRQV